MCVCEYACMRIHLCIHVRMCVMEYIDVRLMLQMSKGAS